MLILDIVNRETQLIGRILLRLLSATCSSRLLMVASTRILSVFGIALVTSVLAACAGGAMVAAAGAGGGIYLTSQGAESMVNADISSVIASVPAHLRSLGITVIDQHTQHAGQETEWIGTTVQGFEVHIQVKSEINNTTRISASVRRNAAEWDKDFAQQIVARISSSSSSTIPRPGSSPNYADVPSKLKQDIQRIATARGIQFDAPAEERLDEVVAAGAQRLQKDMANAEQISEAQQALERILQSLAAAQGQHLGHPVSKPEVDAALQKICPLYPFC